jgi:hypothetical protein
MYLLISSTWYFFFENDHYYLQQAATPNQITQKNSLQRGVSLRQFRVNNVSPLARAGEPLMNKKGFKVTILLN